MSDFDIKYFRKQTGLSREDFAKRIGQSVHTVDSWSSGRRQIPPNTIEHIKSVFNAIDIVQYSVHEDPDLHNTSTGVPYYDVDFTAGFLEVENSQQTKPNSYITHPFFIGSDFVVRASGQSMAKVIKHGDAVGLRKIENWRDFIPMGEIYAIITTNGFRMIKIISPGEEKDSYTLISKPTDSKKDEFPNQQIKKELISHVYKVQASSHLF